MYFSKLLQLLFMISVSVLLTACGGGGGSSDGDQDAEGNVSNPEVLQGFFRDAPVKGVTYVSCNDSYTSCLEGETDENGMFLYSQGYSVRFTIGNLLISEVEGASLITPLIIAGNYEDSITFARFIQALDEDGDLSNGITISEQTKLLAENTTLNKPVFQATESELENLAGEFSVTLPSKEDAAEHIKPTQLLSALLEQNDTYASAILGQKTYPKNAGYNINVLSESAAQRLKLEIWTKASAQILNADQYRNRIKEIEQNDALVEGVLNMASNIVSLASIKVAGSQGTELYLKSFKYIAASGKYVLDIVDDVGNTRSITIGTDPTTDDPQIAFAHSALNTVAFNPVGTAVNLVEAAGGSGNDVVDYSIDLVAPAMEEFSNQVLDQVAKNGAIALSKIKAGGPAVWAKIFIDTARIIAKIEFAREAMSARILQESRLIAYDYLNAYYKSAASEAWMNSDFGLTKNPIKAVKILDKSYSVTVPDNALDTVKQAFLHAVTFGGLLIYEASLQDNRIAQANELIKTTQRFIEDKYQDMINRLGGLPKENGYVEYQNNDYKFLCTGASIIQKVLVKTTESSPYDVPELYSINWTIPEELNPSIYGNKAQISFNEPGVFFTQATVKKLSGEYAEFSAMQSFYVLNCITDESEESRYDVYSQTSTSISYKIADQYAEIFQGWKDPEGNIVRTDLIVTIDYGDFKNLNQLTPTFEAEEPASTVLNDITPKTANINTLTTFTLTGENFPETMAAQIDGADCPAENKQWVSATEYQMQCRHNVAETLEVIAKLESGGELMAGETQQVSFTESAVVSDLPVVDGFDYPFGNRGRGEGADDFRMEVILEQIDPEKNTVYADNSVTQDDYVRYAVGADTNQWYNDQDVGSYYSPMGGIHPGEDWNLGSQNADAGEAIYAIADGQVHTIRSTNRIEEGTEHNKGGWTVVIKHRLHDDSFIYSFYTHVTSANETAGGLSTEASEFTVAEGDSVTKGQLIARLAHGDVMSQIGTSHLHFELRDLEPSLDDADTLWPKANQNGYYSDDQKSLYTDGMTAAQIQNAMETMQTEVGILDPSDFIEVYRISPHILAEATIDGIEHAEANPGETVTFTIKGQNLPASTAISLYGAVCGQTYNISSTQVSTDCTVPETDAAELSLFVKGFPGNSLFLPGAENLAVVVGEASTVAEPGTITDSALKTCINGTLGLEPDATPTQEQYESITYLYCEDREIQELAGIENLTSLQSLYLSSNQVSDVSGLSNLTSLQSLYLSSNQVSDVSGLSNLTSLQYLSLYSNQISDVSGLSNLTSLQYLYLSNNQVSDVSGLSNLTSLQSLDLGSNEISDVSGLSNLTSLQSLDLYRNQVSDVSGLSNLTSLQYLSLYSNQISDVSGLSNLTSLQYLYLSNNQISDVSGLSNLSSDTYLYIFNNCIQDFSPIEHITHVDGKDSQNETCSE